MKLTRRELAPLTLSIAAACASPVPPATAQPRRRLRHGPHPPPPAPLPRLTRENDIAALALLGSDAPAGSLLTLGCALPRGALPRNYGVVARLAGNNREIAVQAQVLARHRDGSARTVMLALPAPSLRPNQHAGVVLSRVPTQGRTL